MRFSSIFSLAAALLGATVQAYGNPGACSGQCWSHDPSVVRRDDGTYFRFETGSKIGIWKAPDLVGPWTYQGAALPSGSKINLKGNDDLWVCPVQPSSSHFRIFTFSAFQLKGSILRHGYQQTGLELMRLDKMSTFQSTYSWSCLG